jgi:porphobilinogen deaminase
MYLESYATLNPAESAERIHAALRDHDPLYKSLQDLLDLKPLEVTVLPSGTFERFQEARLRAGCQMPLAVVPKMNADDTLISELLDAAGRPGPRPA